MSTAVLTTPAAARGADAARPGLARLTLVELRKMTDTRAGFWLLVATATLTVAVAVVAGLALPGEDRVLLDFVALASVPASVLLPVMGILLITSEWSQRTAMLTFALVPRRSRVLVAKLLAGTALAAIAYQLALLVGLGATAVWGADGGATWSLSATMIGQAGLSMLLPMLMGIGFGAVLLASAPAIVLYFVLPTAWGLLGEISALEGPARWLDTGRTMTVLTEAPLSGLEWARLGVSLTLWLVVPLLVGAWRVARADAQ